jgi:hypothetical protein
MASSTHTVQLIYTMLAEGNLSRILPLLDEHMAIHLPERTVFGGVYHGRNGFLALMSNVFQVTDSLSWGPLTHFTPAADAPDDAPEDAVVTTGTVAITLPGKAAAGIFPFCHYWLLQNEKVIVFRAFQWDTDAVTPRLPILEIGPGLSPNGQGTH